MSTLYYCTKENNTCKKKDTCERYINKENDVAATLFKNACTENNNYLLFIQKETEDKNNNGKN